MELCNRMYDLPKKEIQRLLSTITENVLFFKDFKVLRKQWLISSIFKHFKDLYEPCLPFELFAPVVTIPAQFPTQRPNSA